jgi:hypothetical protein
MVMKSTLTFRGPLLFIAAACFLAGIWQYISTPPEAFDIFSKKSKSTTVAGIATVYTTPRGTPRIKVIDAKQRIIYFDCLTNIDICATGINGRSFLVEAEVVNIKYDFYWPINARFSSNKILDLNTSRFLYEIYREREAGLYKFWLMLGLAMGSFSIWFGKRPLMGNNIGEI